MRVLLIALVLAGGTWGVYCLVSSPESSSETAEGSSAESLAEKPTGGSSLAASAVPQRPAADPAQMETLLSDGRKALEADESKGITILSQVLAGDPRGPLGRQAAELMLPVAARRGEARRELTMRWRLNQMDASAWKRLEELNLPLFAFDRIAKDPETSFYSVMPGDSLEKIAKHHGTTVSLIQRLNNRREDDVTIHPGDRLRILPVKGRVSVEVRKSECVAYLLYDGLLVRKYRIGIGTGDLTPEGEFHITTRLENPDWWKDGEMVPHGHPDNILGTRWLGFDKPYQKYAIHGTTMPETIGKKASNGCVRMENKDAEEIYDFCANGTVVTIVP